MAQDMFIKVSYTLGNINISTYPSEFETDCVCGIVLRYSGHNCWCKHAAAGGVSPLLLLH
jgi:hypothetical protein